VDFIQGRDARRMLVFDRQRFSLQILVDLPKIAANDRAKTTLAEDHAIARGTLSYFGAYSVSETDRLLSFFIELSTFPNQNGQERKRLITSLTKDELKFSNSNAAGGTNDTFTWKRAP
jgi:hypothetical protein